MCIGLKCFHKGYSQVAILIDIMDHVLSAYIRFIFAESGHWVHTETTWSISFYPEPGLIHILTIHLGINQIVGAVASPDLLGSWTHLTSCLWLFIICIPRPQPACYLYQLVLACKFITTFLLVLRTYSTISLCYNDASCLWCTGLLRLSSG